MKTSLLKLLVVALSLGVSGLIAQDRPTPPDRPERPTPPMRGPNDQIRIPGGVELPTAVQALVDQFKADRASLVEAREALRVKLEGLSDEERAAAMQAARAASEDLVRAQRDLARQIRKELHDLRKARRDGTGG